MTRRAVVVTAVVLVALVGIFVIVAAVSGGGSGDTTATGAAVQPPGTASSTSPARSVVVLPMGDLSDPTNTFWELFVRTAGADSWKLATPPGVADNGGLVVGSSSASAVTAAFLPSADLTFSVLARSADGTATWSPDSVPGVVADAPDAVDTDSVGTVRAVLGRPRASVVTERAESSGWTQIVGLPAAHRPFPGCTVSGYTAVTATPSGTTVVGAECTASARVGLLESDGSGGWTTSGPTVTGWGTGTTTVLRLGVGTDGVTALAEGTVSSGSSLVAAWGTAAAGTQFTASPQLGVPTGWSVLASATGGGNGEGVTVLLGADDGSALRVRSVGGPGDRWAIVATPPVGTSAVAVVGSEVDAFVPSGSHLDTWSLVSGSSTWRRTARITVPIQYGSSG